MTRPEATRGGSGTPWESQVVNGFLEEFFKLVEFYLLYS